MVQAMRAQVSWCSPNIRGDAVIVWVMLAELGVKIQNVVSRNAVSDDKEQWK